VLLDESEYTQDLGLTHLQAKNIISHLRRASVTARRQPLSGCFARFATRVFCRPCCPSPLSMLLQGWRLNFVDDVSWPQHRLHTQVAGREPSSSWRCNGSTGPDTAESSTAADFAAAR